MNNRKDDRLLFDPVYLSGTKDSSENYSPELTEEELSYFPNLIALEEPVLEARVLGFSPIFEVHVVLTGRAKIQDSHDGKILDKEIEDEVDLTLDGNNEEESDLQKEREGVYDLRGTFLSLLHDALPANYSEVPLERVETEDYVLMSEAEYEKERKKDSPFSVLEDIDLDDKEEK